MGTHNMRMSSLTGALLLALAPTAPDADSDATPTLHDKHCLTCHGTQIYTRPAGSPKTIARCARRWTSGRETCR